MNPISLLRTLAKASSFIDFILIWLTIIISGASFYTMNGFIETLKLRLYHSARNISSGDIKMVSMKDYKVEQMEETKARGKVFRFQPAPPFLCRQWRTTCAMMRPQF